METALKVQFEIFAFVTEKLALIDNNANLVWDPTRGAP
jgi:hypothetical protein